MSDTYKPAADLFQALAHPVRLRILEVLAQGEACVCHLTTVLGQRQPYVSQQLTALREAGLVRDRRDGAIIYYALSNPSIAALLEQARVILAQSGIAVEPLPVPASPVPGCPCPHCVP